MENMIRDDDPISDPGVYERREAFAESHRTRTDREILISSTYVFPDGATMDSNPWGLLATVEDRRRSKPRGSPSGAMDPNAKWENANIIRHYWEVKTEDAKRAYYYWYGNLSHYVAANQAGVVEAGLPPTEEELGNVRRLKKEMNRCSYHWEKARASLEEAVPEWKLRKERQLLANIKANREFEEKLKALDEESEDENSTNIEESEDENSTNIEEEAIKEPLIEEEAIEDDGKDDFWEDDVEQEPEPPKKKQSVRKHKN